MYKQYFYNNVKHRIFYNCFYYDIRACALQILKTMGYLKIHNSLSKLPKDERNKRIGTLLKNKSLSKEFNERIVLTINQFIEDHHIDKDDILFIQKDGILLRTFVKVKNDSTKIYPELRNFFSYIIFGYKNDMYLAKDTNTNETIIKGVLNKTIGLEKFFTQKLMVQDINNFKYINKLINDFYMSNDIELFLIDNKKQNTYDLILKDSVISITYDQYQMFNFNSLMQKIDRHIYFINLIEPFMNTIIRNNI